MNCIIRKGLPSDIPQVFDLIMELATFEKAPEEVIHTPEKLLADGFGEHPQFSLWVAESGTNIVGMAICYIRYSTWKGPCLYLEDIVVTADQRNQGIGKALFDAVMAYAAEKKYPQVNWQVLDWNTPAIQFYEKSGAAFDPHWINVSSRTPYHP